jgi:hypothetical protein
MTSLIDIQARSPVLVPLTLLSVTVVLVLAFSRWGNQEGHLY